MTSTLILPKARLVERRDVTEDLMVMKLEPERQPYTFKPGQYCTLGLKGVERAYSIVSAPHEGFLEIFVELVPEGGLTPLMWDMKLGDEMSLRPTAKGLFTLDPPPPPPFHVGYGDRCGSIHQHGPQLCE